MLLERLQLARLSFMKVLQQETKVKPRILVLIDHYIPAYKSGGPLRTVYNMTCQLSDEFEFWIITRDRDSGDSTAFSSVTLGDWTQQGNAWVFYVPQCDWNIRTLRKLLCDQSYDILYLNSFFSFWVTALPLLLRRLGQLPNVPVVLAPRGEFSPAALKIKKKKKWLYMRLAKVTGLFENVVWQASSEEEKKMILTSSKMFLNSKQTSHPDALFLPDTIVAPDLVAPKFQQQADSSESEYLLGKSDRPRRIIFLSRISPKKNLDFLIRVMTLVTGDIDLAIYGPKEDATYWAYCQRLLEDLPKAVKVNIYNAIEHNQIQEVFSVYDLFAFPTRGENFGHVILESLSAGTPVFISDQVPWKADEAGAVQVLPLDEVQWAQAIQHWLGRSSDELLTMRRAALQYSQFIATASNNTSLQMNRKLFYRALEKSNSVCLGLG
jgi:glycosyltransferase involved in cell wall biosynthesis